jgi:hypothetical protein
MTNQQPIDWEAYRAGKRTGLAIGYAEGLKVGIAVLAEIRFGPPDARFLDEIREMIEPGNLEWILRRLATATSLREVRALDTPAEELDTTAAPQPH